MIISVCNQKGGVGKTTTAINLATALAIKSKSKILLIDFDPQANATTGLGFEKAKLEFSVYNFLYGEISEEAILETKIKNLYILPSAISLCDAEIELIESKEREFRFRERMAEIDLSKYSFILIDTPPSLGMLTINALTASQKVLIPIQCEYYALEGLIDFLNTVDLVKERLNPELDILGILLTMADYRTRIAHDVEREIRKRFNNKVFHTVIHRNVRLAEAPSYGLPIELYDAKSIGAYCYRDLAEEISGLVGGNHGEKEGLRQGTFSFDS